MQVTDVSFNCEWCGVSFVRRCRLGRRPLYCRRSCRQRAYEHRRRGAWFAGLPRPTVAEPRTARPPRYQAGKGGTLRRPVTHALLPDGAANRWGQRPSLCGAAVQPMPFNFFTNGAFGGAHNCIVCARIAKRFPPARDVCPIRDVGTVTSLLKPLRSARLLTDERLRLEVDTVVALFGAPGGAAWVPFADRAVV